MGSEVGSKTEATEQTRARWRTWSGVAALVVLGWALAVLAVIATAYLLYDSGASQNEFVLVFTFLTAVPAVILGFVRSRYARSLAAGLGSAWIFAVWLVVLWHPWTTMSSSEVADATAEIRSSGLFVYYLGDHSGTFEWNDYYRVNSYVYFFYGECHEGPDDGVGDCDDWDVDVRNEVDGTTIAGDLIAGCKRLDPILGVPAITLRSVVDADPYDTLGLFTGTTMILISFADDDLPLAERIQVAEELRPVGEPHADTLPPASDAAVAYVAQNCGQEP